MSNTLEKDYEIINPILVYIQTHLGNDLSLDKLSEKAGLSSSYFHRMFQKVVGETLKSFTTRLRLERAAFGIRFWDMSLTYLSLEVGFGSYETFSRAFRKYFGQSPRSFQKKHSSQTQDHHKNKHNALNNSMNYYETSHVTIKKMNPIHVAFIRHWGSYLDVDVNYYADLQKFVQDEKLTMRENLLIGIGHDDPTITPESKLRFDTCIEIPEPIPPKKHITYQQIFEGLYATLTYVGPYGETMKHAYMELFRKIGNMNKVQAIGLPAIEVYRTTVINPDYELNQTDIYIPVQMKG